MECITVIYKKKIQENSLAIVKRDCCAKDHSTLNMTILTTKGKKILSIFM
jgi:hypothetical protein